MMRGSVWVVIQKTETKTITPTIDAPTLSAFHGRIVPGAIGADDMHIQITEGFKMLNPGESTAWWTMTAKRKRSSISWTPAPGSIPSPFFGEELRQFAVSVSRMAAEAAAETMIDLLANNQPLVDIDTIDLARLEGRRLRDELAEAAVVMAGAIAAAREAKEKCNSAYASDMEDVANREVDKLCDVALMYASTMLRLRLTRW